METSKNNNAISHEDGGGSGNGGLDKAHSHLVPYVHTARTRSRSPDTLSIVSADDFSEFRSGHNAFNDEEDAHPQSPSDTSPSSWGHRFRSHCGRSWVRNKGLALVLIAQVFGTLMNVTTRLLETGSATERGLDPFQILFARMSITTFCSTLYMWYTRVEHFPLGAPGVRGILVLRGLGGFFGVFGLYWSLMYLPLADATVLSFLAPPLACYICSKILKEPFSRTEQIAAFVSTAGVVLIARPTSIFAVSRSDSNDNNPITAAPDNSNSMLVREAAAKQTEATAKQRLAAVAMAMVGVMGASIAYTTIRWIGKRAHPLISVNYFASWCTILSASVLAFVPSVPFILPHSTRQWALLVFIGVSGFAMQFLLTAGLAYEKSSRANNMVYSQMIFALAADALIWKHLPSALSLAGSSLILGSAVIVAAQKENRQPKNSADLIRGEEQQGLMDDVNLLEEGRTSREDLELRDGSAEGTGISRAREVR